MISFAETVNPDRSTGVYTAIRTTKCERCLTGEDATFRACSDLIDMAVCAACAEEARRLGITVERKTESRGDEIWPGKKTRLGR
jgi:hypothetical protein